MIRYTTLDSPLGALLVAGDETGLTHLYLPTGRHPSNPDPAWVRDDEFLAGARRQLAEYFAGERREFDLPLHASGSAFQHKVWDALCDIPYGETRNYGETARAIGMETSASRAVGLANGQNPISIIVPCHRVIGADGSLTGYGGGLPAKKWLLAHEAEHAQVGLFAT